MDGDLSAYLVSGLALGLSAGLSPGPLMALVIRESLERSAAAGMRVACAPLLTDGPIVFACAVALSRLADARAALGVVALAGAVFLFRLGIAGLRARPAADGGVAAAAGAGSALRRGILVNLLSPHPYLFWMTVGAPIVVRAAAGGWAGPVAFLGGFYAALVGSKLAVALAAARARRALSGRAYLWTLRGLGVAMVVLAVLFLREGIDLMGF